MMGIFRNPASGSILPKIAPKPGDGQFVWPPDTSTEFAVQPTPVGDVFDFRQRDAGKDIRHVRSGNKE